MAKDHFHEAVKTALLKDNWEITNDPLELSTGEVELWADLGAERVIGAAKGLEKIAVEIKSFLGQSSVSEFHMEKINKYEQIICEVLQSYFQNKKNAYADLRSHLIIDKEHKHYQLLTIGWHRDKYIYTVAFHFCIQDGKVWILQNNTESFVADELVTKGIEKTDIVLGFQPPQYRQYTDFAVA